MQFTKFNVVYLQQELHCDKHFNTNSIILHYFKALEIIFYDEWSLNLNDSKKCSTA